MNGTTVFLTKNADNNLYILSIDKKDVMKHEALHVKLRKATAIRFAR